MLGAEEVLSRRAEGRGRRPADWWRGAEEPAHRFCECPHCTALSVLLAGRVRFQCTATEPGRCSPASQVLLDPSREELHRRLAKRTGHFMPSTLLNSQLDTLEREPLTDWLCIIGTPDTPNQVKLSTIDEITAYLVQLVRELG